VAAKTGMGTRTNTIMQTCFFAISGILPRVEAIDEIKKAIKKTYGGRGEEIVKKNYAAVDATLEHLTELKVPGAATSKINRPPPVPPEAPEFVQQVTARIIAGKGDSLPVSAMPNDGTFPVGTTKWEKRNIALEIPVWDPKWCIQCGKCVLVCPHAAIRQKVYEPRHLEGAPQAFKSTDFKGKEFKGWKYSLQVAPEDCTGCDLCVDVCPAKNKEEARLKALNMHPQLPLREQEAENFAFFLDLPAVDRRQVRLDQVKGSQFLEPLFEYSGACAGCGETPYLKLMSQLFGDRAIVANATGCSSIYGGNLPTAPWTTDANGRGVAWSNSLFEDNAEFGLGFRLTIDKFVEQAAELCTKLSSDLGDELVGALIGAEQNGEADIYEQRERVAELKKRLGGLEGPEARSLEALADYLVKKSVWIVGGDGWAYDIGYGGLDHVLSTNHNVNILVLDTEVYSNTGGQMSKATPRGAVAKFAASGKPLGKKDLGLLAMAYGSVYVANVAMGANDQHTVRAFLEGEAYDGPSLFLAYSHCIAHGIDMSKGLQQQKKAVESGHWPLYRYNPDNVGQGPMKLDSKAPKIRFADYAYSETRFKMLTKSHPELAKKLLEEAQADVDMRWKLYTQLADMSFTPVPPDTDS
jgi:pyruvate-ferredoxin/flavodoxin oxidoreductase